MSNDTKDQELRNAVRRIAAWAAKYKKDTLLFESLEWGWHGDECPCCALAEHAPDCALAKRLGR